MPHFQLILSLFLSIGTLHLMHGQVNGDDVTPLNKYSGICKDARLEAMSPASGTVVDQETLNFLWRGWGVDDARPTIDFTKNIILVTTVNGPNRALNTPLKLEAGKLSYRVSATRRAGDGFGYLMIVVPKAGIEMVNGKVVPKSKSSGKSVTVSDHIHMEIIGAVKTGVMAIGGETTGTTISSGGATFELDFRSAKQAEFAKKLGQRKAHVSGTLVVFGGVEVKQRFILEVKSIELATTPKRKQIASRQTPFQRKSLPDELKIDGSPVLRRPKTMKKTNNPIALPKRNGSNTKLAVKPNKVEPEKPVDVSKLAAFREILITTKGELLEGKEQIQKVSRTGRVQKELGKIKDEAQIPARRLRLLHDHIQRTDWTTVPRVNRTKNPTRGTFTYTIEIKQRSGSVRFLIDSDLVKTIPAVSMMFRLLR